MLRSLYSGVSGLRNHQVKMDVLGNNIANINTIGFKGGRTLFSESLSQMVSGASKQTGAGFLNPVQIGLGMKTGSIDKTFSQGALENTGNVTDLAIQGDGFFIVRGGDEKYYTRAGNFTLNTDGTFVNNAGLLAQGWMLTNPDIDSSNVTENNLSDIVIDSNLISNAEATENVYLSGNLNVGLRPVAEVWTSGGTMQSKALVEGGAPAVPLTVVAGSNDEFVIELSGNGSTINETILLSAGVYADAAALQTEIDAQIAAPTSNLNGSIEVLVNASGNLKFRSTDNSSSTQITLESGMNDVLTELGFTDGDSGTAGGIVPATTDLNDTLMVTSSLQTGFVIDISGINPDGTNVSGTFTYGVDGTTVDDLITVINASYTGTTASYENGQIVMTDDSMGDSDTTISLTTTSITGEINLPGFFPTTEGYTGKTSTSAVVYDSMGGAHNLVIEFTKTENTGEWTWDASVSGDETIISGGTGRAIFDANGQLTSFTYDNGVQSLQMDPGNGSSTLDINIDGQGTDSFSGLSQFESVSTLNVREQDGRATGYLLGLIIDPDGMISGTFSNGETLEMAKIALAQFGNNQGLMSIGNGLYEPSISSGDALIFGLEENSSMSIESGALEMSNVDLSKELTDMITAQRGFQANSKIITTADQMIDELLRMKR